MLKAALCLADTLHHFLPIPWHVFQRIVHALLDIEISVRCPDIIEIFGDSTHILRDGHVIIVQYNDKICFQLGRIIQCLVRHASGKGSISDHRNDAVLKALDIPGLNEPKPCGNGGGAVPGIKAVTVTLLSFGKTAHSPILAQHLESLPAPGKKLVGIGLMPYVPDDLVLRQVKRKMQRHGQLNRSQVRAQMTACLCYFLNQELTDFLRQRRIILTGYIFDIIGLVDIVEQHIHTLFSYVVFSLFSVDQ